MENNIVNLGYPMARIIRVTPEKQEYGELTFICPDDCTENFPYVPAQNIRVYGKNIIKLCDFLNEHYPISQSQ